MALEQKIVTDLSFINGGLVPAGSVVSIDTDVVTLGDNSPNLVNHGEGYPVNVAVPVAPIAPSGPLPTMPQQVPPGAFQTQQGYVVPGGSLLVGEGSQAAIDAAAADVSEDAPVRRQAAEATGNATTAAIVPLAAPVLSDDDAAELAAFRAKAAQNASEGKPAPFDPTAIIDGTVPDVTARLASLDAEQLAAVKSAEDERDTTRIGVTSAIEAELAKRAEQA